MKQMAILGLVAMLGTGLRAEPQAGVDLARLSGWDIVLGASSIPSECYAAEEFQRLVAQASGNRLPIVAVAAGTDRHVFIGASAALRSSPVGFEVSDYGDEDLRNYMTSRLLWNPELRGPALMDEFLDLHYRRAAPPIRRYIDLVHDNAEKKGIHKNCFGEAKDFDIDETVAQAGLDAFSEARRLADDDTVRARVEKASTMSKHKGLIPACIGLIGSSCSELWLSSPPARYARKNTSRA